MMTGRSCTSHCTNFARVCAQIVEDGDADSVRFAEANNYLAVWGFGCASQPGASQPGVWSGGASQPAAFADLNGDHVAVSGAAARFRPIALGNSFHDRGMRNDSHDAVAVVITLRDSKVGHHPPQLASAGVRLVGPGQAPPRQLRQRLCQCPLVCSQVLFERDGDFCDFCPEECAPR